MSWLEWVMTGYVSGFVASVYVTADLLTAGARTESPSERVPAAEQARIFRASVILSLGWPALWLYAWTRARRARQADAVLMGFGFSEPPPERFQEWQRHTSVAEPVVVRHRGRPL